MVTNVIFASILFVWSIWGGIQYNKKFEEILPISVMGIILILFVFGVLDSLKYGVFFIVMATGGAFVHSVCKMTIQGGGRPQKHC